MSDITQQPIFLKPASINSSNASVHKTITTAASDVCAESNTSKGNHCTVSLVRCLSSTTVTDSKVRELLFTSKPRSSGFSGSSQASLVVSNGVLQPRKIAASTFANARIHLNPGIKSYIRSQPPISIPISSFLKDVPDTPVILHNSESLIFDASANHANGNVSNIQSTSMQNMHEDNPKSCQKVSCSVQNTNGLTSTSQPISTGALTSVHQTTLLLPKPTVNGSVSSSDFSSFLPKKITIKQPSLGTGFLAELGNSDMDYLVGSNSVIQGTLSREQTILFSDQPLPTSSNKVSIKKTVKRKRLAQVVPKNSKPKYIQVKKVVINKPPNSTEGERFSSPTLQQSVLSPIKTLQSSYNPMQQPVKLNMITAQKKTVVVSKVGSSKNVKGPSFSVEEKSNPSHAISTRPLTSKVSIKPDPHCNVIKVNNPHVGQSAFKATPDQHLQHGPNKNVFGLDSDVFEPVNLSRVSDSGNNSLIFSEPEGENVAYEEPLLIVPATVAQSLVKDFLPLGLSSHTISNTMLNTASICNNPSTVSDAHFSVSSTFCDFASIGNNPSVLSHTPLMNATSTFNNIPIISNAVAMTSSVSNTITVASAFPHLLPKNMAPAISHPDKRNVQSYANSALVTKSQLPAIIRNNSLTNSNKKRLTTNDPQSNNSTTKCKRQKITKVQLEPKHQTLQSLLLPPSVTQIPYKEPLVAAELRTSSNYSVLSSVLSLRAANCFPPLHITQHGTSTTSAALTTVTQSYPNTLEAIAPAIKLKRENDLVVIRFSTGVYFLKNPQLCAAQLG